MSSFKDIYRNHWKHTVNKELLVKALFEMWGFEVSKFGYMAASTEYNPNISPDVGKPDWKVEGRGLGSFYVEVTGTFSMPDSYYIRPDKLRWAADHSNEPSYCAFVASDTGEIVFIPMWRVIPFIDHQIKTDAYGKQETFTEIPAPISSERFRRFLFHESTPRLTIGDFTK